MLTFFLWVLMRRFCGFFLCTGLYNRVGKVYLPLLAARPVRRFCGFFLCTGLCNRVGKVYLPLLAARPVRRFCGFFLCTGLCIKTIRTMYNMVLIAYFLMRGEIVSVSTICILLYPINVSKMCLFHKNNIIFLNKR